MWYGPNIGTQLGGQPSGLTNDIGLAMTSCSNDTCVGTPLGLGDAWIKYWIEANPDWSYENMTQDSFEEDFHQAVQRYESITGTNDPNLTAFYKRGGKILGYHGTVGPCIPNYSPKLTKCSVIKLFLSRVRDTTTTKSRKSFLRSTRFTALSKFLDFCTALAVKEDNLQTRSTPFEPGLRMGQCQMNCLIRSRTLMVMSKIAYFARTLRRHG